MKLDLPLFTGNASDSVRLHDSSASTSIVTCCNPCMILKAAVFSIDAILCTSSWVVVEDFRKYLFIRHVYIRALGACISCNEDIPVKYSSRPVVTL